MIKDAIEKNEKATPNGADLEVLKKHFGMCFNSDGSLDLGAQIRPDLKSRIF